MNLTQQEKYTLIGSAGGFVLSRIFGTSLLGTLAIVGVGAYVGYNYDSLKGYISKKPKNNSSNILEVENSKNTLSYLSEGEKSTEDDVKKVISLLNEKKGLNLNYSDSQLKRFIELYTKNVSKKESDYILQLINRNESDFTSDEKKLYSKMISVLNDVVIQRD